MRMHRKLAAVTGGLLMVAASAAVSTTPAAAADGVQYAKLSSSGPSGDYVGQNDCVETTRAKVCYQQYDDKIWVKDLLRDGDTPVANWGYGTGYDDRTGQCQNHHGYGTWAYCDKAFTENKPLALRAFTYDNGQFTSTSKWIYLRT